jgi:hypothetical protein
VKTALPLVHALTNPASCVSLSRDAWTELLSIAHAERLMGSLADRLAGYDLPNPVAAALEQARAETRFGHTQALWEVEMARRLLTSLGIPLILLKGSAFVQAGLPAAKGRVVGDLDILIPRDQLDAAETALLDGGYEWVKDDPYTQHYYRDWMHELPPLIHEERGGMIDVHHTILPLTARRRPDAAALIADRIEVAPGVFILSPPDMIVHAATHMLADGDLAGGLRNLWDIDRLLRSFANQPDFWTGLAARAEHHQMREPVALALRLTHCLYETPVDIEVAGRPRPTDALFVRRLLARNGWGQETRKLTRLVFYIRSHWLRMPPLMLARHLWIKARG